MGKGPLHNEPRFKENHIITNTFQKRKRKIYLDKMNKFQHVTEG